MASMFRITHYPSKEIFNFAMNSLVYGEYEFVQHKSITAREDDIDDSTITPVADV